LAFALGRLAVLGRRRRLGSERACDRPRYQYRHEQEDQQREDQLLPPGRDKRRLLGSVHFIVPVRIVVVVIMRTMPVRIVRVARFSVVALFFFVFVLFHQSISDSRFQISD
jgi:hypothetical protein